MRVAAVQFAPKFKAVRENLATMVSMIREAVGKGAQLVVLPELATTGYSFMSVTEVEPFAETPDEKSVVTQGMLTLAKQHNVAIAWGMPTKDAGSPNLYNSQVLVLPDGRWVRAKKINQWGNDFLWATEGRESPPVITFEGRKLGTLVCRDIRDKGPQWSPLKDFYEPGDANIVCFSANFGAGAFPSVSWIEFARMNKVWLIVSNRYGEEMPNDFGHGGICVVSPEGKVHCEGLVWDKPCIVYADVP